VRGGCPVREPRSHGAEWVKGRPQADRAATPQAPLTRVASAITAAWGPGAASAPAATGRRPPTATTVRRSGTRARVGRCPCASHRTPVLVTRGCKNHLG
jgi:hypothetical protein